MFLEGEYSSIGRTADCGSEGWRFKSFYLPVNIFNFILRYNNFTFKYKKFKVTQLSVFLNKSNFLTNYYLLNEFFWQEGLLIDFLQKKTINNWIQKFCIYASYLFNERLVFDKLIKFYLELIIWPFQNFFIFEFNNVSNLFFIIIFLFFSLFFLLFFNFVFILMF